MPSTERGEFLILISAIGSSVIGTCVVAVGSEIDGLFVCGAALILVLLLVGGTDRNDATD
jgi:hypothetical protein